MLPKRASRKNNGSTPKLNALQAPEVECVSLGKRRAPYEFGLKSFAAYLDLGCRSVDADNPHATIKHRGKKVATAHDCQEGSALLAWPPFAAV